jgi:REP element-mobilizing transposase RayT
MSVSLVRWTTRGSTPAVTCRTAISPDRFRRSRSGSRIRCRRVSWTHGGILPQVRRPTRRLAWNSFAGSRTLKTRGVEAACFVKLALAQWYRKNSSPDMGRNRLIEWCVMPNHVHVLIGMRERRPLGPIVQQWKGASAFRVNRMLGRSGKLWIKDYFDRFIRDQDHFENARLYIRRNPVKAGLCQEPEQWALSSAGVSWKL